MSVKPDINYYRDHKVRQYAIVYFATEQAVSKAMLLSGSRLGDAEITVSRHLLFWHPHLYLFGPGLQERWRPP